MIDKKVGYWKILFITKTLVLPFQMSKEVFGCNPNANYMMMLKVLIARTFEGLISNKTLRFLKTAQARNTMLA